VLVFQLVYELRDLDESLAALISVLHRFDAATLATAKQEMRRNSIYGSKSSGAPAFWTHATYRK
jgi:hypothetical protein